MGWKAFRMENCQSWEDQTFSLDNGLTVIEGMSEVGKSVFVKCIRLGLAHNKYTPRKRKSIVRNWHLSNSEPAKFTIITDEDYLIQFTFNLTNMYTTVINPDKSVRTYKGPADKETIKLLQLVSTEDRIMNILDNETPMLLDGTDAGYNDSVLGDFITHKELENMKRTTESNLAFYKEKLTRARRAERDYKHKLAGIPEFGDLEWIRNNLVNIRELNNTTTVIEKVIPRIEKIIDKESPRKINIGMNDLVEFNRKNKNMKNIIELLEPYFKDKISTTEEVFNLEELLSKLKVIETVSTLLSKELIQEEVIVIDSNTAEECNNSLRIIKRVILSMANIGVCDSIRILPKNTLKDIENNYKKLLELVSILISIQKQNTLIKIRKEVLNKGEELLYVKEEIYKKLKVCPLCEGTLKAVN